MAAALANLEGGNSLHDTVCTNPRPGGDVVYLGCVGLFLFILSAYPIASSAQERCPCFVAEQVAGMCLLSSAAILNPPLDGGGFMKLVLPRSSMLLRY